MENLVNNFLFYPYPPNNHCYLVLLGKTDNNNDNNDNKQEKTEERKKKNGWKERKMKREKIEKNRQRRKLKVQLWHQTFLFVLFFLLMFFFFRFVSFRFVSFRFVFTEHFIMFLKQELDQTTTWPINHFLVQIVPRFFFFLENPIKNEHWMTLWTTIS